MDEKSVVEAAQEAIRDLELDCEVKSVFRSSGKDDWCVQLSGKYGQFCDGFKDQFGKENSAKVIREKIKSHLIKQVSKIRSSTGRKRKGAVGAPSEKAEGGILAAALQPIGDVLDSAASIAGEVIQTASGIAKAAGKAATEVASEVVPVRVEVLTTSTRAVKKTAASSTAKKVVGATKVKSAKPKKPIKQAMRQARKQVKKPVRLTRKTSKATSAKKAVKVARKPASPAKKRTKRKQ